jgi:hypothetical protein
LPCASLGKQVITCLHYSTICDSVNNLAKLEG